MLLKTHDAPNLSAASTKPLNPRAREWRPRNSQTPNTPPLKPHQLLPHIIFAADSLPAAAAQHTVVPLAAPLLPQAYHYSVPFPAGYQGFGLHGPCTQPQPFYSGYSPPYECPYAAEAPHVFGDEQKRGGPIWSVRGSMLKDPQRRNLPAAGRMGVPPRMRRGIRSFPVEKKKPVCRQQWKPKKSGPHIVGVANNGGAAVPPACQEISPSSKTTVMIKNIPNQLRRDFMLEFLDGYCIKYSLEYDFLYLPMDFIKMDNLGYAFVNFTTADAAHNFKEALQNYQWTTDKTRRGKFTSSKICEVTWARIQGKEGLVKRFENSLFTCSRSDFLPVLLDPPRNGSDPNPPPPVIVGRLL